MNIKEVVTITPKRPGSNTKLICRTKIGDKWFVLTDSFKILTDEQLNGRDHYGERVMEIPFNRVSRSFRFAFDLMTPEKPDPDSGIDIVEWKNKRNEESDRYNAAFNFFAKHMQIEVVGMKNPYLVGEPMYIMDFINHRSINNVLKNRKKNDVFNKVNSMDLQQKLNLALNYMPSLYGKRHSEIMDRLVDFEHGLLMQDAYIDEFLNNYDEKNLNVSMNTYMNKAIMMGLIEKRNNGLYIHGNEFIGVDEQAAIAHFNRDPESYNNYIVPRVNQSLKLPEDDLQIVIPDISKRIAAIKDNNKHTKMEPEVSKAKYEMLKQEAAMLGIKSIDKKTHKQLSDEVERVKRGLEEA